MPATFALDGAFNSFQGGNDLGAGMACIGTASNQSGVINTQIEFTPTTVDFVAHHIGDGALTTSVNNTGNIVQEPPAITAGSGYNIGSYTVDSDASGGQPAGAASLYFTIAGGAITAARVRRPGSGFTSAPTFTIANGVNLNGLGVGVGAGTLGAIVVTVGLGSRGNMLGAAFGFNKGTRYLNAAGTVPNGSAISGGYLNRSGRTMVAGEGAWAVAP